MICEVTAPLSLMLLVIKMIFLGRRRIFLGRLYRCKLPSDCAYNKEPAKNFYATFQDCRITDEGHHLQHD